MLNLRYEHMVLTYQHMGFTVYQHIQVSLRFFLTEAFEDIGIFFYTLSSFWVKIHKAGSAKKSFYLLAWDGFTDYHCWQWQPEVLARESLLLSCTFYDGRKRLQDQLQEAWITVCGQT
jgi:hypothetical protein